MTEDHARIVAEAINDLIDAKLRDERPAHNRAAKDRPIDEYLATLIEALIGE